MEHRYKILYRTDKGLMAYEGSFVVFVNSRSAKSCTEGVAILDRESLISKGSYGFANFKNVETVVPLHYGDIDFYNNNGVPHTMQLGTFGNCTFLKEIYLSGREVIRGFLCHGDCVIYENKYKRGNEVLNPFYTRLDNAVGTWKDITEDTITRILDSLFKEDYNIDLSDISIKNVMYGKTQYKTYLTSCGALLLDGKFETLAIWQKNGRIQMCWLGRKLDYSKYSCTDISDKIATLYARNK